MNLKLDYKKTFLIGFGSLGISIMWVLYNTYVPIYLQAGNPAFDSQLTVQTFGFGLSATLTGFIMTLDNIAAFFIQPIMGAISDRTYTRIGRRMPYILIFAPVAVLAFALIPLVPQMIPASLNGQVGQLSGLFAFFAAALGVMLLAMAVFRTPVIALMPDLTPSPLRSKPLSSSPSPAGSSPPASAASEPSSWGWPSLPCCWRSLSSLRWCQS